MAITTNGNGWSKWAVNFLAVSLWGAFVSAIIFLGNVVKANDVRNIEAREKLKNEMLLRDEKVVDKIECIKDIVSEIKTQQAVQMSILKRIENGN